MKIKCNTRACSVLFNVLKANQISGNVLMAANICESVPATYMLAGIQPFFCDISLADYQIDKECVVSYIEKHSINVLHYNHTYGYLSDEDNSFLVEIRRSFPDVFIVDDRCLCLPEVDIGCSVADVVLYSTGPVKCVDIGYGGYGVLQDDVGYDEFPLNFEPSDLEMFERHIKECHKDPSVFNKDVLFSKWLNVSPVVQHEYLETVKRKMTEVQEHKRMLNEIYSCIPGSLSPGYCNWRYQLMLENSRECINAIFDRGLFCSAHYMSLGNGYYSDVKTPNCDYLEKHVVNLFNDYRFTRDQAIALSELLCDIARPVVK